MTATEKLTRGLRTFVSDVAQGFFEVTHNGFALLGLAVMFATITLVARPELRDAGEAQLMTWLQERQAVINGFVSNVDAIDRATAADPKGLTKEQASVVFWLSKKYSVAPEPVSALVTEAFEAGVKTKLDPTLILAVIAIESGFNPFAQSHVGAQGLMQVMTKIHSEKYQQFGGMLAAFDPVSNLRVGAKVLQECVARAGSLQGGLKLYVGAGNMPEDGGYSAKVMAEYERLQQVAAGKSVPMFSPVPVPVKAEPAPQSDTETVASLVNS